MGRNRSRLWGVVVCCLLLVGAACVGTIRGTELEQAPLRRNPFDVPDVDAPDDEEVRRFERQGLGRDTDANAEPWSDRRVEVAPGSIEGDWEGRWAGFTRPEDWRYGQARIRTSGGRVYILFDDGSDTWLIDCKRDGNRLVGRYQHTRSRTDTSPWVGVIVGDDRIDGIYDQGRWDLRRRSVPPS